MNVKKLVNYLCVALLVASVSSCSDKNDEPTPNPSSEYVFGIDGGNTSCNKVLFDDKGNADANGMCIGNGEKNFVFTGKQTLPKGTYLLKGWVYIANGAELTFEPGTVVKGDKQTMAALIAERGGKLIAQGTADAPIVFTSEEEVGKRKPGDWGGIVLCGKAPNNQNNDQQIEGGPRSHHGGNDPKDNSGVLSYVRIEFAGYPFMTDKEINGLTFGSVGSGTKIDHVQVSYSNDDAYEWFGGSVNCKYLISYKSWDDDFDTDNGFCGKVQYGLSVKDSHIADVSQSNGFESDNCGDGSAVSPFTTAVFSNITFVGPMVHDGFKNDNTYINGGSMNPNNGSSLGKFQAAMQIRRSSKLNCFNSLAVGFPIGLIIDGEKGSTVASAKDGSLKLENIWFANMGVIGSDANKIYDDVLYDAAGKKVIDANKESYSHTFFMSQSGNDYKDLNALALSDPFGIGVSCVPSLGSPVLSAARFTNALLNGFDAVSYIGAFDSNSNNAWTKGWTNFDPENTKY